MKKLLFAGILLLSAYVVLAQEQDYKAIQEKAKGFVRQGDYTNAILLLNRGLQTDPNNLELQKDLAFAYYLHRDYVHALGVAKPFQDRKDVDVQSYQILGMIYKAIEEKKDCEKMYKAAVKKFPNSGVLYSEYGEMLWSKNEYNPAVQLWEKGIESDPGYSGNYYNAAKFYFFSPNKIWGLIYGEVFVNLESYSARTAEMKNMLLEGYKKLFTESDMAKNQDSKNDFVRAYIEVMKSQSGYIAANGITPESLSAIRTKFVLDWFQKYSPAFPFRLFEYQQQLLKSGMFDAYNQWIFGMAASLPAYENWTRAHQDEYKQFDYFQHNRVFKQPTGQYYQTASK